MTNISQRDAFWNRVYEMAVRDRDIIVVTADMGAPSLDRFKKDIPAQFVNVGIAEQNGIQIAAGLCLSGKKAFVYAIAPFVTLRCLEQIRISCAVMGIPIVIVGVGAGFGYEDSGPTHHLTEDIAILRSMPRLTVHNMTDSTMAAAFGEIACRAKTPCYVRLDRQVLPPLYAADADFSSGLCALKEGAEAFIVSTGNMTHAAVALAKALEEKKISVGVIDVYTFPIREEAFLEKVRSAKRLVTLEENFLPGGLGSAVCEVLNDHRLPVPVKRLGLPTRKGYCYVYGGREAIWEYYGIDRGTVEKEVVGFLRS